MADIEMDEVEGLAEMAQLSLRQEELSRITTELGSILAHVKELQAVDVEGVPPTSHVLLDALSLRQDVPRPSLDRDAVMAQAPNSREGSFVVPAFVDEG